MVKNPAGSLAASTMAAGKEAPPPTSRKRIPDGGRWSAGKKAGNPPVEAYFAKMKFIWTKRSSFRRIGALQVLAVAYFDKMNYFCRNEVLQVPVEAYFTGMKLLGCLWKRILPE